MTSRLPGFCMADGVEHSARGLVDPVRRIAEAGLQGGALETDRARIAIVEALDPRVLLAETDAAGEQDDGRSEGDAAQLDGKRRGGFFELPGGARGGA